MKKINKSIRWYKDFPNSAKNTKKKKERKD